MNKNGYILVETIVVLGVTLTSLLALFSGYVLLTKSANQRKYFDNINDIYKVNVVRKTITTSDVLITKENCTNYMNEDCEYLFDEFNLDFVIKTTDINTLKKSNNKIYKEDFKKYLSKLDDKKDYVLISRDLKYYASLESGEHNE